MLDTDSSFHRWLAHLRVGNEQAVERLWKNFFEQLVVLARGKLHQRYRRLVDEEDVVVSAFDSFCRGIQLGRFPRLADRDDLWKLLVAITVNKILHVVRDQKRLKRGGPGAANQNQTDDEYAMVDQLVGREPTPEFAAQVTEEFERLLSQLPSDELVQLAVWKFEGYSNEEIATRWGRATRTVERKLQLIRQTWERELRQ